MKKNIPILILLMALALTACAHTKKKYKKKKKVTTTTTKAISRQPQITEVSMNRTACFGRCPNYVIIVRSDGMAEYQGRQFTKYKGIYQKEIGRTRAKEILDSFMKYRADTCKESYTVIIPDVPGIDYELTVDGKKKKINNASFGPAFLRQLGQTIDYYIQVDDSWKQTRDNVPGY